MKYLLDTNTCIRIMTGRSESARSKIRTIPVQDIVIPSIVRAELWYGAAKSQTPVDSRRKQDVFLAPYASLPFDDTTADLAAQVRATLEKQGTPIGPLDSLIAATALAHQLILVTHNTREFSRIPNLQIDDWET
jgi:tRNA(fMet)-specific endonuclease VapC